MADRDHQSTTEQFELLLACYRSGQVSERQWQEHLRDPAFAHWLEAERKRAGAD